MAVLATPDWLHNMDNTRQRTSPANEAQAQVSLPHITQQQQGHQQQQQQHQQQQQQQLLHQQQQLLLAQQQAGYTYPVQQQAQGSWQPNITAAPFYPPSFYQNHPQQGTPQAYQTPQAPFFDPANAQLAAQWAYQQMMFNAQQHGFQQQLASPHRAGNAPQGTPDYFSQAQIPPVFISGTPPPHGQRALEQQAQPYPGFHPYRRPNRQTSEERQMPHPPYARADASGSSSSVNSSSSQRQRTNSNQSGHSSGHNVPAPSARGPSAAQSSSRGSPSPVASSSSSSPLRQPHIRSGSASSSASTSTATSGSIRPTPSLPTTATSTASASTSTTGAASVSPTPRLTRPSPLSQGNFTAAEKRRSRDDIDLGAMHTESTPTANMIRSGGLKGRLRRALSFNAAQTLKEEADAEIAAEKATAEGRDDDADDDDVSIKASQVNGKLKAKPTVPAIKVKTSAASGTEDEGPTSASTSGSSMPVKKKGRAASLFNSRLNASTDNISLSSTVSSASVMIRKLGAMGKLARRNSLAGITSLFKDKDKDKSKDSDGGEGSKGKKKEKDKDKKSAKGMASVASVSHVTAELDRPSATGDWSVGTDMNGLSPAAKLARQHTLKSNAEAAAKAKEAREAREARDAKEAAATAAAAAGNGHRVNGVIANGTQVPTWDRNTTTRQGSLSPVKGGSASGGSGVRINEDGTRTLIEEEDDESDEGHYGGQQQYSGAQYPGGQHQHADGWDDDEDWDVDADIPEEDEEDVTIRVGIEPRSSGESADSDRQVYAQQHLQQPQPSSEMEPWAVDIRRSVEKARKPAKGILKRAETYDQQSYLHDSTSHAQRARANSYNNAGQSEAGPLARIPSPDPDHIDGLHRHPSHSSSHGPSSSRSSLPEEASAPLLPPLSFDANISRFSGAFSTSAIANATKDLPDTPTTATSSTFSASTSFTSVASNTGGSNASGAHAENRTSAIFQHPNFNSSAPALSTMASTGTLPPTLTHRSATTPSKRLTFATNLSVYDTFSASVYDRRSEPATWSRLTPALAQRIKEELNSYKMEEMEVHAASRVHTQFFV